jgi:hypothetical protein
MPETAIDYLTLSIAGIAEKEQRLRRIDFGGQAAHWSRAARPRIHDRLFGG